ncbi:hypothetical protein M9458_053887 [Cirrhinus mrigala]|uniref:Retrotransposon gag domain-containing protein n=1 Tax=Cirrhinus mrigala TaxID=683832 RepID=A0ABD0MME6_CIRMR
MASPAKRPKLQGKEEEVNDSICGYLHNVSCVRISIWFILDYLIKQHLLDLRSSPAPYTHTHDVHTVTESPTKKPRMTWAEDLLLNLQQGERSLEVYVEEFLSVYHLVRWSDKMVNACFQMGLKDDRLFQLISPNDYYRPVADFINFVLDLCGSSFQVMVEDGNPPPIWKHAVAPPHQQPEPSAYHSSDLTPSLSPACPQVGHSSMMVLSPAIQAAAKSKSACKMAATTPASAHKMAATPEPARKMAATPESARKMAAAPESARKMASVPEPPAKMAAKTEPPAKMATKTEPLAKMAAKTEPPAKMAAAPELTDPPERPQATARTEPAHPVSPLETPSPPESPLGSSSRPEPARPERRPGPAPQELPSEPTSPLSFPEPSQDTAPLPEPSQDTASLSESSQAAESIQAAESSQATAVVPESSQAAPARTPEPELPPAHPPEAELTSGVKATPEPSIAGEAAPMPPEVSAQAVEPHREAALTVELSASPISLSTSSIPAFSRSPSLTRLPAQPWRAPAHPPEPELCPARPPEPEVEHCPARPPEPEPDLCPARPPEPALYPALTRAGKTVNSPKKILGGGYSPVQPWPPGLFTRPWLPESPDPPWPHELCDPPWRPYLYPVSPVAPTLPPPLVCIRRETRLFGGGR